MLVSENYGPKNSYGLKIDDSRCWKLSQNTIMNITVILWSIMIVLPQYRREKMLCSTQNFRQRWKTIIIQAKLTRREIHVWQAKWKKVNRELWANFNWVIHLW